MNFDPIGFVFFVFGILFGSFANVVIVRLPKHESVVLPSSHCRSCNQKIRWFDNIPLLSYLLLRGRCRACGAKVSWRYPFVEFLMGALFALSYAVLGLTPDLVEALILVFGLVTVTFIDIDHMILPDKFTLPGIVIGLIGSILNPNRSFWDALAGVLLGGGFLWMMAYLYWVWRNQEGMGGGDIKLLAWIGAVLGWRAVPFVIMVASIAGTIGGLIAIFRSSDEGLKKAIPFGPYIAGAALLFLFAAGDFWSTIYLDFFGLNSPGGFSTE